LQVIADFTNFNIVTSDSVAGAVTLRLQDVPWDQALDIILQAKGLGMRKNGNVLWIAPRTKSLPRKSWSVSPMWHWRAGALANPIFHLELCQSA